MLPELDVEHLPRASPHGEREVRGGIQEDLAIKAPTAGSRASSWCQNQKLCSPAKGSRPHLVWGSVGATAPMALPQAKGLGRKAGAKWDAKCGVSDLGHT